MSRLHTGSILAPGERFIGMHSYVTSDDRLTDELVDDLESLIGDPWGCGDYSLWQDVLKAMVDNRPAYWTRNGDEEHRAFCRVANQLSISVAFSLMEEKDRFTFLSSLVVLNLH